MILLGEIKGKQIWYINLRNDHNWRSELPDRNWVVFTIANDEDTEMVNDVVRECMDKGVSYTCSAGSLAHYVEDSFDWAQVERAIISEDGKAANVICTTAHENFIDGFWYAVFCTWTDDEPIDKVVCLDFTTRGVRQYLVNLTERLNNDWVPEDGEVEDIIYDV